MKRLLPIILLAGCGHEEVPENPILCMGRGDVTGYWRDLNAPIATKDNVVLAINCQGLLERCDQNFEYTRPTDGNVITVALKNEPPLDGSGNPQDAGCPRMGTYSCTLYPNGIDMAVQCGSFTMSLRRMNQ
jgi:hypothetical protein